MNWTHLYQDKPICSVSSIVWGKVLFNVSGKIKTNDAATRDNKPYKRIGKLIQIRV